jgi:CheY-like chemotaxis protein
MSAADKSRKAVLFVDDDPEFLGLLQPYMERLSRGTWEVLVADNSASALSALDSHSIDLAVLDVRMPVIDGVQLLQLCQRKSPQLKKAVMTGHVDDACRSAALANGAELVLEKPRDSAGYEAFFAALNELLMSQAEQGFRGVLRRVGLEDIVQMECLSRHSLILEVSARATRGRLYIREGALVHAEFGELTGEPALQELLILASGEFHHRAFAEPPRQTLEGSWEFLLMEAARKRDEVAGENPEAAFGLAAAANSSTAVEEATKAPVVNEMVVCGTTGEVLFAEHAPNAHQRCAMCRDLMEAAARVQALISLGSLERIEFVSSSGRTIMRVHESHAIFVRASDV